MRFRIKQHNSTTNKLHFGCYVDNKPFKEPDQDGCTDLKSAWVLECEKLNKKYPQINHTVEDEN